MFSQTRIKADAAFAFDLNHNVSMLNMYFFRETKFDLNKGFGFGVGSSSLSWGFGPDEHEFYNDFVRGTEYENAHAEVDEYDIEVNALDVPIAFNFYTKPNTYYTFTTHLNFITKATFKGWDPQIREVVYGELPSSELKGFYASYEVSAMRIVSRRLEVGFGVLYGGGARLFKDESYESYAGYNKAVGKNWFFRIYLMRLYLWQKEK
jgi:hypothetical protein